MFVPSKKFCINETTIAFKGRCKEIVYNPNNPDKWCLQLKEVCNCKSKYLYFINLLNGQSCSLIDAISFFNYCFRIL